jgi:predicted aldo/keto reductase-like oxidoreductase
MRTHYNVYGLEAPAKKAMAKYLADGGKCYSDCKQCGLCEKNCPQHLKIRENLEKVFNILTK